MSESAAPPVRRLSGFAAASRLSQRVSTVLNKSNGGSSSAPPTMKGPSAPVPSVPVAVAPINGLGGPRPAGAVSAQVAATAATTNGNNGPDSILEQLRTFEREGFIPPRSCCGFKRVSVGKIMTNGSEISFRVLVLNQTHFDITIAKGMGSSAIEQCTILVNDTSKLNSRGRSFANLQSGAISHPAFKSGTIGGWLPHYSAGVLVYLVLRMLEDDGVEMEIANAAVGPIGFDLCLPIGVAIMKGKRGTMEDYKLVYPVQKAVQLFGVFDGHGGSTAAEFASRTYPNSFYNFFTSPSTPQDHHGRALAIRRALRSAMEEVDRRFLSETKETAGSTACVAAVDLENLVVHVANVGDTRCVLCREGRAMDLSIDHKAVHPAEIARIMDMGGFVARGRALGLLAVSRALGDRDLKRSGTDLSPVTAVPDCDSFVLDPSRDEFILIACDGLFDVMSSQQVVAFIRARLAEGLSQEAAVNALALHAIDTLGSLDNVTILLIGLDWNYIGVIPASSSSSTPRTMRAPTIKRTESATVRAAKASAHKRQTSRMSSTESSNASLGGFTSGGASFQ